MVEIDNRKATLIGELEVSRGEVRNAFRSMEAQLDVASRLRANVRRNTGLWMSFAAAGGWLISKVIIARLGRPVPVAMPVTVSSKDPHKSSVGGRGIFQSLLRMGFDLAKPALLEWLANGVSSYLTAQPTSATRRKTDAHHER